MMDPRTIIEQTIIERTIIEQMIIERMIIDGTIIKSLNLGLLYRNSWNSEILSNGHFYQKSDPGPKTGPKTGQDWPGTLSWTSHFWPQPD